MAAKVYQVECDSDKYLHFLFEFQRRDIERGYTFDGQSHRAAWKKQGLWISEPRHLKPDIWEIAELGAFVLSMDSYTTLRHVLDPAAEALPVEYHGDEYRIINVTNVVDCLDAERSVLGALPDGRRGFLERPVFRLKRLPRITLFRIRERCFDLYTVERKKDPREEFKAAVENNAMKGLTFNLVWEER